MKLSFANYSKMSGSRRLRQDKKYRIMEMILATLQNVYCTHVNEMALTKKNQIEIEGSDYHKNRLTKFLKCPLSQYSRAISGISRCTER